MNLADIDPLSVPCGFCGHENGWHACLNGWTDCRHAFGTPDECECASYQEPIS